MSDLGAKIAAKDNGGKRSDLPRGESSRDKRLLKQIQKEAKAKGSFLTSGGKGGLDPGLVLHVLQRDGYRCQANVDLNKDTPGKTHDELGTQENGGIGVHHLGGIPATAKLSKQGHENSMQNLIAICQSCHDKMHKLANKKGTDSSQVLPKGDVDTKRDHGDKPVAPA